jgi:flagella basal body P-ring formation protein FlgA
MIIAAIALASVTALDCRVVTADVIRMSDVAVVEPILSKLDADMIVGYSPLPGSVRILQAAQLARLARRNGISDGEFRDACFQRAMRELKEQELEAAVRQALGIPDAGIEMVDFSRYPAPVGDLVFPRSGLALTSPPQSGPLVWKGYVAYGSGHQFPIWARVNVHARLNRVVALDNLVTSSPVRADQVRMEPLNGVPDALAPAQSLDQVIGRTLLRPIRRGATVSLDDIANVTAVRRGNKVDVDLDAGPLHLKFEATAESDGRFGDRIRLRNLQSGHTFIAEVCGKDQARIVPEN